MRALVVPTAADLASELEFTHDRLLVTSPKPSTSAICGHENGKPIACVAKSAYSPDDLRASIWKYNRRKVECVGIVEDCSALTFDSAKETHPHSSSQSDPCFNFDCYLALTFQRPEAMFSRSKAHDNIRDSGGIRY